MPETWIEDRTGESPWHKQSEILRALATNRRVAVASANGCGKSWLAARAAVWFLNTYRPSIVVTTAPTDRQVRRILWREIHRVAAAAEAMGKGLGGKLLNKAWEMAADHFAFGFATRDYDADSFQGLHAEHILVIVDEAAGISEPIWEGIMSVLRGEHAKLLAIGNPTNLDGTFYRAFSAKGWWTSHISAFETPNLQGNGIVVPGLVTARDIEDAREDWGEGSFLWQARILGQFPDKVEDTLISLSWVEAAGHEEPLREGPVEVAADIARYGGDSTVFVARQGGCAFHGVEYSQQSTMETAGKLVKYCRDNKADVLKIDAVGLGAGVVDRCKEVLKDVSIIEMNAGGKPIDSSNYADAGTEWWHQLAKSLQQGALGGPVFQEKRVLRELSARRYKYMSDGRMKLQSKEEMRGKGLKSPDWGDAIAMAFAAPKAGPNYKVRPVIDLTQTSRWR
jgi:phage terminase large subunit